MSDDDTLDGLHRSLSLADAADDPAWEAVAAGRAPVEQAGAAAGIDGDEAAALGPLFSPLSEAALNAIEAATNRADGAQPDAVLDGLARALADESPGSRPLEDDVWDALAEGRLDDDAATALRDGPEDGHLAALFEPLDTAALERIERALDSASGEGARPSGARVLRFPIRRAAAVGGALALAAAALVFALQPGDDMPGYSLEMSAGDQQVRSGDGTGEAPLFRRNSTLDLLLRPERAAAAPTVTVELLAPDGPRPVDLPVSINAAGAVTYAGPAAPLFVAPPGTYTLRITLIADGARRAFETAIRLVDGPP